MTAPEIALLVEAASNARVCVVMGASERRIAMAEKLKLSGGAYGSANAAAVVTLEDGYHRIAAPAYA